MNTMDFRNWLELESMLKVASQHILSTLKVERGYVRITFPANYESFVSKSTAPTIQQPQAMTIAAGTIYAGDKLDEARQGGTKDVGAMKSLQQVANPKWSDAQWKSFQQITAKTGSIGRQMGLLFELEIIVYLMTNKGLQDQEEDGTIRSINLFNKKRRGYIQEIEKVVFDKAKTKQIIFMVQSHAANLAEQIYEQSSKLLKCTPDSLRFSGGGSDWALERKNPADLFIACKSKEMGWNVKFTSETRVHVMSATPNSLYRVFGGTDEEQFNQDFAHHMQGAADYNFYDTFRAATIAVLTPLAQEKFEGNPVAFTNLFNQLLSGNNKTGMAVRNWASPSMGGAQWSVNIQKDFDIKGTKLLPKSDANVEVTSNDTYLKLNYKRPGGSFDGTSILFQPRNDSVTVKVTNLTTDRR